MKRISLLIVLIGIVALYGLQMVAAVTSSCDPGTYIVSVNSAKVRAEASASSAQIALVRRNALVPVTGGAEGARVSGSTLWCSVAMVGDGVGYIHSSLLSAPTGEVAPAEPIPVVSSNPAPATNTTTTSNPTAIPPVAQISTPAPQGVACPSRSYTCSQLTCEQAYACMRAGNGRLDRDNDGVPCESICPGG